jgi:hypothetical protein
VISHESLALVLEDPNVVRVDYVQLDGRVDMGGKLFVSRANLAYVAEQLEAACAPDYAATDVQRGPERLRVYGSGSDQQPIVNILCNREPGGLSGLMLTIASAQKLAAMLRAEAARASQSGEKV